MSRYIDADKLRDNIDEWLDTVGYCTIGKGLSYYGELIGCIKDTPTADVEKVRHGKWILQDGYITCSSCFEQPYRNHRHIDFQKLYQRCPFCGAKMDGGAQ